jgi:acetolactate synthase-1/2/3 large subunit
LYVKDIIALWLKKLGVQIVFGIPGSYVLPIIDSITRHGIRFILTQHEYGAALMADGFSKATEKVGCIITTTGIGATNALSGILNSYSDFQPVIIITGQVPVMNFGKGAMQESVGVNRTADLEVLFGQITKYSKLIKSVGELLHVLHEAESFLFEKKEGPVHLCIPVDIFQSECSYSGFKSPREMEQIMVSDNELSILKQLLTEAKKPLLLLGAGAKYKRNETLISTLAQFGLPVATSLRGKGLLDERNPMSLGCIGLYGHSHANYFLNMHADLIIAVGISMSEYSTQCWDNVFKKVKLIHVDIDPQQIGKIYNPILGINMESHDFLKCLAQLDLFQNRTWDEAKEAVMASKQKFSIKYSDKPFDSAINGKINPIAVIREIFKLMPEDKTIWVCDSVVWTETNLFLNGSDKQIEALNQASIGYAPAASIGVKLARQNSYVVAVFGDGGFRQTGFELATANNHNIPVLWINLNNEKYASIYNAQKKYYHGNIVGTTYKSIDHIELCKSLGVDAIRITNLDEVKPAIQSFIERERPLLLDIHIDDTLPEMKARQLIRYQQWKFTEPTPKKDPKEQQLMIKWIMENRY